MLHNVEMLTTPNIMAVYNDLFSLGLVHDRAIEMDSSDVIRAVTATRRIGDSRPPRHPNLQTDFGIMVYETMKTNIEFGAHPLIANDQIYACGDAENHMVNNIMFPRTGFSPIIIKYGDEPMGIIKGSGEPTVYVLQSLYTHDLIARTISLPEQLIDPRFLPLGVPAHVINLEESEHYTPLRFALTALPEEAKVPALADYYRDSALLDHTAIIDRATHLVEVGRIVLRDELEEAIDATALYMQYDR